MRPQAPPPTPPEPRPFPPPRGGNQVWFRRLSAPLQRRPIRVCERGVSDGSGELDCHYLSPSPPQLSLRLTPFAASHLDSRRSLWHSSLPGLRWQSFKDHTSRTHTRTGAVLPARVSIHTWEGDYTSPPRQPQITINGDANH